MSQAEQLEAMHRLRPSEAAAATMLARQRFDSVYFFMWPGWRDQLESNRWHWGKRWAQRLPVVFIQPELTAGLPWCAEPEPRLDNVTLLSIESAPADPAAALTVGLRQTGQLADFMRQRGHRLPLFWLYNSWLSVAYVFLPGSARVFHGTENYFDFGTLDEAALNLTRFAIEASDLVICCSSGVALGFAAHSHCTDPVIISNGCEYQKYRYPTAPIGQWPDKIIDWLDAGRRLAVFAGNINQRLDYRLMNEIARREPETGFLYAGPVDTECLSVAQREAWDYLLRQPNVRALGRLPPQDLPALYHGCDLGIIPYRDDVPMIVENGFPLKALEMAAAGLPVVSTWMKPLREIPEAVVVTDSAQRFCAAVAANSRRTRSPAAAAAADRLCRVYDYDVLFDRMLYEISARSGVDHSAPGNVAAFASRIGIAAYSSMLIRFAPSERGHSLDNLAIRWWTRIPAPLRRAVPSSLRRLVRRRVG